MTELKYVDIKNVPDESTIYPGGTRIAGWYICLKCNIFIDEKNNFCPKCGRKINHARKVNVETAERL